MIGRVRFWTGKGYGFLTGDDGDGNDVFCHISVVRGGYASLAQGQAVRFEIVKRPDGRLCASNVTVCEPIISERRNDDAGQLRQMSFLR
jgi:CspA family cold shock protein